MSFGQQCLLLIHVGGTKFQYRFSYSSRIASIVIQPDLNSGLFMEILFTSWYLLLCLFFLLSFTKILCVLKFLSD